MAVAILAVSLLAFMNFQSQSILSSARAQRISVSTLLARQKMGEVLLEIEEGIPKGEFPDEREEAGTFDQPPGYFWKYSIRKAEIPQPNVPEGQTDLMAQAFQFLSDELNRSTREVRLTVGWTEFEEEEEGITVVTHVVNPGGR